jgi:mRNA-degrading endonuclease toxin of MazEF toxin-antitoxin module
VAGDVYTVDLLVGVAVDQADPRVAVVLGNPPYSTTPISPVAYFAVTVKCA